MEFVDRDKMCRLCLLGSESLICIFEMNNMHGYIAAEVIEDLLQLNVTEGDGYPHQVCSLCLTKLTDFKLFKEQCQTSKLTYDNVFAPNESHVEYCPQSNMIQIMSVKDEPLEREYGDDDEDNEACNSTGFDKGASRLRLSHQRNKSDLNKDMPLETIDEEQQVGREEGVIHGPRPTDCAATSINEKETRAELTLAQYGNDSCGMNGEIMSDEEVAIGDEEGQNGERGERESNRGDEWQDGKEEEEVKDKRFVCQECGMSFEYHNKLVQHQYTHNGERPFQCHICEKRFNRRGSLVLHLRTHTGEKPYLCRECGKGFSQKYSMVMHVRNHSGQKPYPCDECPKSFNTRCDLKRHKKTHSLEEKPTDCATCGERFVSNAELRKHEAMHTGGKVYTCDWCSKVFIQRKSLVIHLRSHTGERPFKCQECGKGFARKYSLDLHLRIHERVRPYPCDECNKRFNSASHLKRHKRQHGMEVETEPFETVVS